MTENYDAFWRELSEKASFKDFYSEPTDEKSDKDIKLLCEILGDATVLDTDDHVVRISCHEWKWSDEHKLNCLDYSLDNAKKLTSVLQSIARGNRREIDIHKPTKEARK